ncbi:MAG: response regulator [candidate division Zixibacteria bacterium]|nr:response regulator [candidate division Zixibacteria bacterium]
MEKHRARILVVDDDANLLELLADTLTTIGYKALGAKDGMQALQMLRQEKFDLMISDIKMPVMDGIDLLKKVRRYYPRLPVLFITGFTVPEVMGEASPDGFLAKPFRISRLEKLIEQTLVGRRESVDSPIRYVMVVDDNDNSREALADMLTANNYIPLSVSSAQEALGELDEGRIDAVIAGIKLPGMNGVSLLHAIKEKRPGMPVVLVAAFSSPDDTGGGPDSFAADGFLHKPLKAENVVELLSELAPAPADRIE